MKVIIAGSRGITNEQLIFSAIKDSGFEITEVVSGGAEGVDKFGEKYANRFDIPLKIFPADWKRKKASAGIIRNAEMANYAEALIAVWDGKSKGTKNMIEIAGRKGLLVFVEIVEPTPGKERVVKGA